MSVRRHLGFGSTPNFKNLYTTVNSMTDRNERLAYANYDPSLGVSPTEAQLELLRSFKPNMPTLTFTGSEKLHGENMAVCFSQGELWVQGRNNINTLLGDQNGMAQFVESTRNTWLDIIIQLSDIHSINSNTQTLVLDMEWAGGNIQKGNAACSGTDKGAYIFDYCRIVDNTTDIAQYKSTEGINIVEGTNIYIMRNFSSYTLQMDFNNASECEQQLKELAESIEAKSPIAQYFNKPDNVGEGAYLWCEYKGEMLRVKTKGELHGGKPKVPKNKTNISDEEVLRLTTLAETVTPTWRLTQAIKESKATEMKHIGLVIKWVMQDIAKEELPALLEAKLELKQLNPYIAKIVKDYYVDSLKPY